MTKLIEYEQASDEVRVVYDDIRATRKTDYINNFWKAIANHPPLYGERGRHSKKWWLVPANSIR